MISGIFRRKEALRSRMGCGSIVPEPQKYVEFQVEAYTISLHAEVF